MAINSNPMLTPGQDIPPEVLQQLMAMRPQDWQPGNTRGQWYDPKAGQFGPTLTYEPTMRTEGVGNGSSEVWAGTGNNYISQGVNDSTWGGKNVAHVWDDKGKYLGTSSAAADMRQLARLAAIGAGGAYAGNLYQAAQAAQAVAPTTTVLGGDALSVSLPSAAEIGSGLTVPATTGTTGALTTGTLATTAGSQLVKSALDSAMTPQNWIDLAKVGTAVLGTVATAGDDSTDDAQTRANSISDAQLQGMQFALDQSKELADYNRTTFRPVEQRLVQGAMDYATPGRMESAAQEATGRVASEFDQTRNQAGREMIRYGVDPSTIAALGASSQLDEAKARAGAANAARDSVEQQGWSRMADVANLGRNIASSQATQQQIGLRAGDSAAANAATSARLGQAEDEQLVKGIGQIGNYVGELFAKSDKTKKRGTGKMADSAKALKQIEKTPVHEGWTYKDDPTKEQRIGPMAQDVQRISGDHAAPGGKVIDMVSQQGRMMAAVQELARKVKKLEAA